jgi:hypothetical protein
MARALAGRVKLNVAFPRNDSPLILENISLTYLDTVDLPARDSAILEPVSFPFAISHYPPAAIPLYGTPCMRVRKPAHGAGGCREKRFRPEP